MDLYLSTMGAENFYYRNLWQVLSYCCCDNAGEEYTSKLGNSSAAPDMQDKIGKYRPRLLVFAFGLVASPP